MSSGLDYVSGPSIAELKAARIDGNPVSFVCRYLSAVNAATITKLLTSGEAHALTQAGIAVVSNYEWYANRALEGEASGVQDAHIAASQHAACGGPVDRPIYFSVDIDTSSTAVLNYFRGVASVIGLHRTGAYGSFRVLHDLFNANAITWGWQTYAWSYGAWEARAHIQQYENGVQMVGHSVDYNRSIKSDFGQWFFMGSEVNVAIDIHTPGVSAEFKELDGQHWQSLKSGKIIQNALLADYKSNGKCSLEYLGHPTSNEVYYAPGKVRQNYQFGVRGWEADKGVYPLDLYADGSQGQDPRLAPLQKQTADLQAQVTQLEAQPTPEPTNVVPADVQAKLDHDTSVLQQASQLVQQTLQVLAS